MNLSILYRGPLSSCNYGCTYCPFAKHHETREEHETDRRALERFVDWVAHQTNRKISVFFTPWGEALIHKRYQQAFINLTNMPHVEKVTIQTNLAVRLEWVELCDKEKMALWATYHPTEVTQQKFLDKCRELLTRQVRFSVGIVGMQEHLAEIDELRQKLPDEVYLWINAYKRIPDYYTPTQLDDLTRIDPLFPINNVRHPSRGKACRTGEQVISVDGNGDIRRCHFIKQIIGNIYTSALNNILKPRLCTNQTCSCHIGYVHMPQHQLDEVFQTGILERIPARKIW